ncbi:MAG: hypothetical protein KME16_09655 [Scytolyngbya sp. HA4215-MV1]|jgi:hypothetical protein|nr:hypothetical protein [Scytolyngbya sp. HA4215-MV1]
MSRFSPKFLAFYSTTFALVVILFSMVSTFGETRLTAPPPIEGHYRVTRSSLPDCLLPNSVGLNLHQSGIYLNASFSQMAASTGTTQAFEPTVKTDHPATLIGRWHTPNLVLVGQVLPAYLHAKRGMTHSETTICSGNAPISVKLQATLQQKVLQGSLELGSPPIKIDFLAERQAVAQKVPDH